MKSGENGLIGPGDNNYGKNEPKGYRGHSKRNPAISLMLQAANELERACGRIAGLEKQIQWVRVADELPPIYKRVIRTHFRVEGHPEYDNQCIDYLTKDCNTGELKWFNDRRKPEPENECWMPLQAPPLKGE